MTDVNGQELPDLKRPMFPGTMVRAIPARGPEGSNGDAAPLELPQ